MQGLLVIFAKLKSVSVLEVSSEPTDIRHVRLTKHASA